jgi:hypothetical protein
LEVKKIGETIYQLYVSSVSTNLFVSLDNCDGGSGDDTFYKLPFLLSGF